MTEFAVQMKIVVSPYHRNRGLLEHLRIPDAFEPDSAGGVDVICELRSRQTVQSARVVYREQQRAGREEFPCSLSVMRVHRIEKLLRNRQGRVRFLLRGHSKRACQQNKDQSRHLASLVAFAASRFITIEAAVKITGLETIRIVEFPQLLWVEIATDEGIAGLGETFFSAGSVEAYLHEDVAPQLLGRDPLAIDSIARDLRVYLGFRSTGVELRAASAVDIALWDLFGKVSNQPVVQLLGGWTRDRIRTYNTCAGGQYMRRAETQSTQNWGIAAGSSERVTGFDDLNDFLTRADELAESLLSEGITAMKIWPFDPAAERTHGHYISSADLKQALQPFEKIRSRVGDKIDIMVEFHSMWQLLPAIEIAKALAPFHTFWHEDPIKMDSLQSLKRYASASPAPLCASETLAGRWAFRDLLETEAAGIVMLDIAWCGGLSEARKIAAMAEAWHLPVAPHDCTGPIVFAASTHLSLNATNALLQESVRAFYRGWYPEVMQGVPQVKNGFVTVENTPGHGCRLRDDLEQRFTVTRRTSQLAKT